MIINKKKNWHLADFAVPAELTEKIRENEKKTNTWTLPEIIL